MKYHRLTADLISIYAKLFGVGFVVGVTLRSTQLRVARNAFVMDCEFTGWARPWRDEYTIRKRAKLAFLMRLRSEGAWGYYKVKAKELLRLTPSFPGIGV